MSEQAKVIPKTRVQLDLAPLEVERMNWMMEACDLDTRKDLFNHALSVFAWVVKERIEGRKVASFDDQTKDRYILSMPSIDTAADKGRPQVSYKQREPIFARAG